MFKSNRDKNTLITARNTLLDVVADLHIDGHHDEAREAMVSAGLVNAMIRQLDNKE